LQNHPPSSSDRSFLFDASRLVWRVWTGRLPTGIDRVCLAYMEHYGPRALALVQRGELRLVLDPQDSDKLFDLLQRGGKGFRTRLIRLLARALAKRFRPHLANMVYLNIGHTGLDAPGLPGWVKRRGLRAVFLIHDLIPITHPEFCREGEQQRHRARMRHALECAGGIIANSAATLDELGAFARAEGLPMAGSVVAWLGADEQVEPAAAASSDRPYFLVIGTIEARKNHLLLLHVWERLVTRMGQQAPQLILVGQRGWEADDVFALLDRSPRLQGHVIELGRCSDARMWALIDGARALLMPSLVEGFGIPVIEALQRGTPVIASDLPVFREIAGNIPLYLDPLDGQHWEAAIRDFTTNCPERQRQLAAMPEFRAPDWSAHFDRVDQWLETV
jgi:glycosyltransferase involved in cell wall biosynthesis